MIWKEYGAPDKPVVLLIHGGGLSNWMWRPQIEVLRQEYHVITPILDGHGEDHQTVYESISKSADQVIDFIDKKFNGSVFAICGLSVGAQITVEVLARANKIAQKAVIESALVFPSESIAILTKPVLNLSFSLIKKRWFAKRQAKQMYVSGNMFEDYFRDSTGMSKKSMLNLLTDNARYSIPMNLKNTTADVLVLCGTKEYKPMRRSAVLLHQTIENSVLEMVSGCGHGISLKLPEVYLDLVQKFFASEKSMKKKPDKL